MILHSLNVLSFGVTLPKDCSYIPIRNTYFTLNKICLRIAEQLETFSP